MLKSNRLLLLVLFLFLCVFAYTAYISPIVHDSWGYRVKGLADFSLEDVFRRYQSTFMNNNPRIGQFFLHLSGYSSFAIAATALLSFTGLMISGFVIVFGRLPKVSNYHDIGYLFIFFAVMVAGGREIGKIFFYTPYTTNYLTAYAIFLVFLIPYRLDMGEHRLQDSWWLRIAVALWGGLAGLTNEHTVPIYIAILGFALTMLIATKRVRYLSFWHISGFLGLILGYLALYFAPAQSKRYGGIKNEGFLSIIEDFPARFAKVSSYLFAHSWPFFVALVLVGIFVYRRWRQSEWVEQHKVHLCVASVLLAAALGMAYTVMASPLIGQRLMFSSYVNLALVICCLIPVVIESRKIIVTIMAVSLVYSNIYMFRAFYWYNEYQLEFDAKYDSAAEEVQNGERHIVLEPYTLDFRKAREFIYRDPQEVADPNVRLNRLRASYLGAESVTFKTSPGDP